MNEAKRQERNAQRLQECYPTFRKKVAAILSDLEGHGLRPRIQDAWRSPADQLKAYQNGNSKLRYGFHNVTNASGAPESLACDILDDDHPTAVPTRYLLIYAASARAHGLETGILWGLPPKLRDAVNTAIAQKDWEAHVKVGWDPTHVQPTGMTPQEAKAGKRPK